MEKRYPRFGALEGESAETAYVRLNPFGRRVCQMLSRLAQFYEGKGYALNEMARRLSSLNRTSGFAEDTSARQ